MTKSRDYSRLFSKEKRRLKKNAKGKEVLKDELLKLMIMSTQTQFPILKGKSEGVILRP